MSGNREDGVTIGIVVYNTPLEDLIATLKSIRAAADLRENQIERIVVLCNGAQADYQAAIAALCRDQSVDLIPNAENRGFGAGHNAILHATTSRWYVCCNPDVTIEMDTLARLLAHSRTMETQGQAHGLLMPRVLNSDGSDQAIVRRHLTLPNWLERQIWRFFPQVIQPYEATFDYTRTQRIEFVSGCFFLARTEDLRRLGGFDEAFFLYAEDADLSRRAETFGSNWYVAEARITHGWKAAWKNSRHAFKENLRSVFRYFRKHGFFRPRRNHDVQLR